MVPKGVKANGEMRHTKTCRRGHEKSGDNLYITPSGQHVCKKCREINRAKYRQKPETREYSRIRSQAWRLKQYGVTAEEVQEAKTRQQGKCATCRKRKPLVVDHCHTNLRFRGLLCKACNTTLGLVEDDPDILQRMIGYLKER